jgi:hypothetical protein
VVCVSVGSTPAAHTVEDLTVATGLRAGNYAFDLVMAGRNVSQVQVLALSVVVTVTGPGQALVWRENVLSLTLVDEAVILDMDRTFSLEPGGALCVCLHAEKPTVVPPVEAPSLFSPLERSVTTNTCLSLSHLRTPAHEGLGCAGCT